MKTKKAVQKTVVKGSDQPPTLVGLDDERSKTGEKIGDVKKGGITDQVMEQQGEHHEVVRY